MRSPEQAEPDFYSFREQQTREEVEEAARNQRRDGATWFRITLVDGGVWIEGWKVRPSVEAPFNPPTGELPGGF